MNLRIYQGINSIYQQAIYAQTETLEIGSYFIACLLITIIERKTNYRQQHDTIILTLYSSYV